MEPMQVGRRGPLVSVVVPTVGRSPWLGQAVDSALHQTYRSCEVLVVDDSPDGHAGREWTLERGLRDGERLRLIHSGGVGGSAARNAGVAAARGEWIAFLDDDDEWLPEKLERQMEAALRVSGLMPVMSCRVKVQTPRSEYVFPRRIYREGESISEYLFCRKGWASGAGFMQTSTLLAPRELLLRAPFTAWLPLHQDWDWLLRVSRKPDVSVRMLAEPLVVYRTEDGRQTVSRRPDWRRSLEWIRGHAQWVEPKALSWFIAVQCVWKARAARAGWREWAEITRAFCYEGQPTAKAAAQFAIFAVIPAAWRKRVRDRVWRSPRALQAQIGGREWKLVSRPKAL